MTLKTLQTTSPNESQHRLIISETVNRILTGRANNTGTFTLEAGATTTDVIDPAFESSMVPLWIPTTAHAAADMNSMYLSARDNGTFTVTHANNANVDRTFLYVRWG